MRKRVAFAALAALAGVARMPGQSGEAAFYRVNVRLAMHPFSVTD